MLQVYKSAAGLTPDLVAARALETFQRFYFTSGSHVGHDRGLAFIDGEYVPVALVDAGTEEAFAKELQAMWKGLKLGPVAPAPVPDFRERLGLGDAKKDGPVKAEEEDDEVRTLDVTWDDESVRYKNWRDTCAASQVHTFSDFPLEGPITTLDLAKHMQKFGGDPSNWMMQFAREKHIAATDRTLHELKVLTGVLQAAGT